QGGAWSAIGGMFGRAFDPARRVVALGDDIFVAGTINQAFDTAGHALGARNIVRWSGGWHLVSSPGIDSYGPGPTSAMAGRGTCGPFVAGDYDLVGETWINGVGRLGPDGQLSALTTASRLTPPPRQLAVGPDGTLYAAGQTWIETSSRRIEAPVARLRGDTWEPIGMPFIANVAGIVVDEGGTVYVGGNFENPEDPALSHLLRARGDTWAPVGTREPRPVTALALIDGALVIAEDLGDGTSQIARYRDGAWETVGTSLPAYVRVVFGDPGGLLIAGANITASSSVARLTGTSWEPVGRMPADAFVAALQRVGDTLVAVGRFALTAGGPGVNAAYLDTDTFRPLGGGLDAAVGSLFQTSRGLLLVGEFESAGGIASSGVARFEPR
ncbi:MAG: hypothetical protein AB7P00_14055, partial [Sandaracinaceae bacterium]